MRTFAAAAALALAMATGAAANKPVTTIGEWTDPAAETRPAGLPSGYKVSQYQGSVVVVVTATTTAAAAAAASSCA